jgi:hypothetical protein
MTAAPWPALPYDAWSATRDTLHAHTQVLGKLAVALAPAEPQLQHAALRLTPRGWETLPLPAPDESGALVVALNLHTHDAVIEHSSGRMHRVALGPNRPVAEVTRDVLARVRALAGPVQINTKPQEVSWSTPLDEDYEHAAYDADAVETYLTAATHAALALAALRAPYRGRSSPVNAWWGTFDLAVSLYSGRAVDPPTTDFIARNSADAQQIEIGWWPGDERYPRAAFYAFASPEQAGIEAGDVSPDAAHWDPDMGEYILDWDDVRRAPAPHAAVLDFGRSVIRHACHVCDWAPDLASSAQGAHPPVT